MARLISALTKQKSVPRLNNISLRFSPKEKLRMQAFLTSVRSRTR
jgi:hypothetical protein